MARAVVGRMAAGVAAWALGASTAAAVGVLAMSLIGSALADRSMPPMAAAADTPSPSPGSTGIPSVPPRGPASPAIADPRAEAPAGGSVAPTMTSGPQRVERVLTVSAGTVAAQCTGDQAYLVSWSPAQGYHAEDVRRGPATTVKVSFESSWGHITLRVRCVGGVPQGTVVREHEDGK